MPECAALRDMRRLTLATVLFAGRWASCRLMICVQQRSALSPHARRLIECSIKAGAGSA